MIRLVKFLFWVLVRMLSSFLVVFFLLENFKIIDLMVLMSVGMFRWRLMMKLVLVGVN